MLTCFCTVGEEMVACEARAAKLKEALAEPRGALWLDLEAPTEDEASVLAEVFRFHPTAIDPCLSPDVNMPLAMVFDDYLFLLIHGIDSKAATELLNTVEVGFFIGRNYLVTVHRGFSRSIEAARKACSDKSGPLTRGVDVMVKDILSRIMDNYRPVIQELEERLKRVHGQVLSREPPSSLLNDIRNIRHKSLQLQHILAPQAEVLEAISGEDSALIGKSVKPYLKDTYNRLNRLLARVETQRELDDTALNIYLGMVSNRLNQIMKLLSITA